MTRNQGPEPELQKPEPYEPELYSRFLLWNFLPIALSLIPDPFCVCVCNLLQMPPSRANFKVRSKVADIVEQPIAGNSRSRERSPTTWAQAKPKSLKHYSQRPLNQILSPNRKLIWIIKWWIFQHPKSWCKKGKIRNLLGVGMHSKTRAEIWRASSFLLYIIGSASSK